MRLLWVLIPVLATTAGCTGMVVTQSNQACKPSATTKCNQRSPDSAFLAPAAPDNAPMFLDNSTPTSPANTGPQPILPVTGGPPVIGIPLGGNMYLPETGGPPVVGIPLFP